MQVPPDSPVGEDHADDKQERTAATVPRLKTQESCKVVKVEAKVCANLEQDNQQRVLFAALHPPNGLYRLQGIWAHATDRISMKLCQFLVHVVIRVSPNTSCGDMWGGFHQVQIICMFVGTWQEHVRRKNIYIYPFRSTTKSYPCVATDISSELSLNA